MIIPVACACDPEMPCMTVDFQRVRPPCGQASHVSWWQWNTVPVFQNRPPVAGYTHAGPLPSILFTDRAETGRREWYPTPGGAGRYRNRSDDRYSAVFRELYRNQLM